MTFTVIAEIHGQWNVAGLEKFCATIEEVDAEITSFLAIDSVQKLIERGARVIFHVSKNTVAH